MTMDVDHLNIPVLDESGLDAIRALDENGGNDLLREILATYFASCPGLLSQLDEGISTGSIDKVRLATHTLKSSSANLGALRLAGLCKAAETAVRGNDLGTARALAPSIHQTYRETCEALARSIAD